MRLFNMFTLQKFFRHDFRVYGVNKINDDLIWLYSMSTINQSIHYLGKIENNKYVEPINYDKLDWSIKKGTERLWRLILLGQDIWNPLAKPSKICYSEKMKSVANIKRNRSLVQDRISDPLKWSYGELGRKYEVDKTTAEDIFKRDILKYTNKQQVEKYYKTIDLIKEKKLSTTINK